jgi:hypothetical protein
MNRQDYFLAFFFAFFFVVFFGAHFAQANISPEPDISTGIDKHYQQENLHLGNRYHLHRFGTT